MKKLAVVLSMHLALPALAADRPAAGNPATPSALLAARGKGKKATAKPAETKAITPEEKRPPSDPRAAAASAAEERGGAAADPGARRGMARIEFDDRLIQGQTNKANAIYLFERRESALRSLLKKRTDFRDEIDETLEQ